MKYFILLLFLFQFPERPTNYVTDPDNILMDSEEKSLNDKLRAFEENTTTQLFVYVAKSLDGNDLEQYSKTIFNKWGIGQKDKDNGVLLALFVDDREQRIQVGYGLESALPSDLLTEIQQDYMNPQFREGKYYEGINAGVDQLIYYSSNEYQPKNKNYDLWVTVAWISAASFILVMINFAFLKKRKNPPKRRRKLMLIATAFLFVPLLGPAAGEVFQLDFSQLFLMPPLVGALALLMLTVVTSDKDGPKSDHSSDDYYERRMYERRSEPDSDDSYSGGDGGSSDSGGSSSKW